MDQYMNAFFGGVIIALSTSLMLYMNGKISGISGILGTAIESLSLKESWRYFFLLGLILGGITLRYFLPEFFSYTYSFESSEIVIAGILVGFGTRMGSGCTSGHGVCGIPRLSIRSIVATLVFMASGIITVLIKGML